MPILSPPISISVLPKYVKSSLCLFYYLSFSLKTLYIPFSHRRSAGEGVGGQGARAPSLGSYPDRSGYIFGKIRKYSGKP